jgi:RHS repeat-associated protein
VTDQLGTPRLIFDKTGALDKTKRHDYLPFGEEISIGTGGRTAAQGYSGDNVRQKFTSKERDNETGLDYFLARYYSSAGGRFTSPDPTLLSVNGFNAQTWNRYSYVLNNPLAFVDPFGLWALKVKTVYKLDGDGNVRHDGSDFYTAL